MLVLFTVGAIGVLYTAGAISGMPITLAMFAGIWWAHYWNLLGFRM